MNSQVSNEQRVRLKNRYSSAILKFKQNEKIRHNMAVAAFTLNQVP